MALIVWFRSSGCYRPITKEDIEIMIGCLIVLTMIWIIGISIVYFKYVKKKKDRYFYSKFDDFIFDQSPSLWILNGAMYFIIGAIILLASGKAVSWLIF